MTDLSTVSLRQFKEAGYATGFGYPLAAWNDCNAALTGTGSSRSRRAGRIEMVSDMGPPVIGYFTDGTSID